MLDIHVVFEEEFLKFIFRYILCLLAVIAKTDC